MEKEQFRACCQAMADHFIAGDPMELARFYVYPLVIYHGNNVRVEIGPRDTVDAVLRRRARARDAGTDRILADILDASVSLDGRLQLRSSWSFLDKSGTPLDVTVVKYFATKSSESTYRISMIQFESLAFSDTPFSPVSGHGPH